MTKLTKSGAGTENAEQRHVRIYKTIRERISLLKYEPGTVLSEAELASEFAVSRTPIRKVLQRLHYEGLTEVRNGVGTIVTDINLKTLKEIYDLRMRLAELMGELSPAVLTDEHPAALEQQLEKVRALHGTHDYLTGQTSWDSSIGATAFPASAYKSEKPSFWGNTAWPTFGPDRLGVGESSKIIPAKVRFLNAQNGNGSFCYMD